MNEENKPQQRRASLRGKGRDILFGQQSETPSSYDDDLGFNGDEGANQDAPEFPGDDDTMMMPGGAVPEPRTVSQPPYSGDALPLGERTPEMAETLFQPFYQPAGEVETLVPGVPEEWVDVDDEHEGGLADTVTEIREPELLPEPFVPAPKRPDAATLFDPTNPPDDNLLELLVDDDRIRRLADQIEAMQEELARDFPGTRATADQFQRELLQASGKLLESRENYDDARAIVYRIRTDMNRQRRIHENIMRYRPMLLNYYIGWGIALAVLFLLKPLFTGVTDAVGIETAAAMYYPMLLGVVGALLSGFLTLERHSTRYRDFDPIHISWYLYNPLLGAVLGVLMFLLASIANEDLLREAASDAEHAITYLLCVVAGMNQNHVLDRLNDLLKRYVRGEDDDDEAQAEKPRT